MSMVNRHALSLGSTCSLTSGGKLAAKASASDKRSRWPSSASRRVEPPCPSLLAVATGLPSNSTVAVKHSVSSLAKSATLRFFSVMRSWVLVSMVSPDVDRVMTRPWRDVATIPWVGERRHRCPGGQRSPVRCRGELAGGVGGTHGSLDTLAAGMVLRQQQHMRWSIGVAPPCVIQQSEFIANGLPRPKKSSPKGAGREDYSTLVSLPSVSKLRRTVAPASLGCGVYRQDFGSSSSMARAGETEQPTAMNVAMVCASASSRPWS